jgi:hypothetical protein
VVTFPFEELDPPPPPPPAQAVSVKTEMDMVNKLKDLFIYSLDRELIEKRKHGILWLINIVSG